MSMPSSISYECPRPLTIMIFRALPQIPARASPEASVAIACIAAVFNRRSAVMLVAKRLEWH